MIQHQAAMHWSPDALSRTGLQCCDGCVMAHDRGIGLDRAEAVKGQCVDLRGCATDLPVMRSSWQRLPPPLERGGGPTNDRS